MPQLVFRRVGRYLVNVHSPEVPEDGEWSSFIETMRAHDKELDGQLIYSQGGGPTYRQRQALFEVTRTLSQSRPVAFMHSSRLLRSVISVGALVNKNPMKTFELGDFTGALDFLKVPAELRKTVPAVVRELEQELNARF